MKFNVLVLVKMLRCYEEQNPKYIKENKRIDENGLVIITQRYL